MNTLASGDAWVAGKQSGETNIAERFEALWSVSGRLVNEPNSRRHGTSETIRLALKKAQYGLQPGNYFIKRQQAYYYRAFSTLGTRHPTCSREFDALRQFKSLGLDVPEVAYFHHERDSKRAILITRELVGYRDLKSDRTAAKYPLAHRAGSLPVPSFSWAAFDPLSPRCALSGPCVRFRRFGGVYRPRKSQGHVEPSGECLDGYKPIPEVRAGFVATRDRNHIGAL